MHRLSEWSGEQIGLLNFSWQNSSPPEKKVMREASSSEDRATKAEHSISYSSAPTETPIILLPTHNQ